MHSLREKQNKHIKKCVLVGDKCNRKNKSVKGVKSVKEAKGPTVYLGDQEASSTKGSFIQPTNIDKIPTVCGALPEVLGYIWTKRKIPAVRVCTFWGVGR